MSEATIGVRALGRVILILGLCALAATGGLHGRGRYDFVTGTRVSTSTEKAYHRAFDERGYPLYQKQQWFPASQMRDDNPSWVALCNQIRAWERDAEALKTRQGKAEERARRGRLRADRYQTPALLSSAATVAGLVIMVLGRSDRRSPEGGRQS